jgi:hypothetical protein
MKRLKTTITLFACVIFAAVTALAVSEHATGQQDASKPPCSDCHICPNPTVKDLCLKKCMNSKPISVTQIDKEPKKVPSMLVMGKADSEYGLVHFDHETHARMESMDKGCESCHHYSDSNTYEACSTCHNKPQTLGQPGLKGVYHRHCLGCHREWDHANDCGKCHKPSTSAELNSSSKTQFAIGRNEYVPAVPAQMVFDVNKGPGKKVTFYHNEHAGKFGLNCNDCHQKQECGTCHDQTKPASMNKSEKEVHSLCSGCHKNDRCETCHGTKERKPFAHDKANWRLEKYHTDLECAACHSTGHRITGLQTGCNNCHSKWNSDNFSHSITGFIIDDVHADFDCEDCHTNRRFHDKPDCSGCHDDGRTADSDPPGVRRVITTSQLMPTAEFE